MKSRATTRSRKSCCWQATRPRASRPATPARSGDARALSLARTGAAGNSRRAGSRSRSVAVAFPASQRRFVFRLQHPRPGLPRRLQLWFRWRCAPTSWATGSAGSCCDGDRVRSFIAPGQGATGPVNAGVYVIDRSIVAGIDRLPASLEQNVFPVLAAKRRHERNALSAGISSTSAFPKILRAPMSS